MSERPTVVAAARLPDPARARLESLADVVDVVELPAGEWGAALKKASAFIIHSAVKVDAALLAQAPALELVASVSVGYDNVDLAALRTRGIRLTNTRGSLDDAVADLTYGLVIAAVRRLGRAQRWVQDGRWAAGDPPFGRDLAGAVLGIVGFGGIGPKVAQRARVSGMRVVYSNRCPRADDAATGAAYRTFPALLAESDCVVVLTPLTPQTRGLFDAAAFAAMKPDAVFVNVARGAIADTAALVRALDAGTLGGAALDVTDPEPLPAGHALLDRDDVILTPHVGSATRETRARMASVAAENVEAYLTGQPLPTPVALDA